MCDGSCSDIGTGSHYPYRCPECERQSDYESDVETTLQSLKDRIYALDIEVGLLKEAKDDG